jgi:uncharacterized coiled-coil protein SlyX
LRKNKINKGSVHLDARIQKLRERLTKHRLKISEMEAQATEMEKEIKKAEEEQLGYLVRSVASTLSGGIDEVFEILRGLKTKPGNVSANAVKPDNPNKSDEIKEGETVDGTDETE